MVNDPQWVQWVAVPLEIVHAPPGENTRAIALIQVCAI